MKKVQKMKSGSYILTKALVDYGAEYIFGYTGGAIMPFFDELRKFPKIKHIKVRNEQGAAFAAQGWARATGKVGFITTTSGPGATNTVTGVADAFMDSVPIMAITGQVPTTVVGTDAFQESDMVGIMYPITKQSIMATSADTLYEKFFELTDIATQGRSGPVHMDLPKDVQTQQVSRRIRHTRKKKDYYPIQSVPKELYREALNIINNAKCPIAFCGHGVILSNAYKEFKQFVEKGNIPFANTMHGISALPSDHPLSLGMMGMHGTIAANRAIFKSDCIIAFGMRFDDRVTAKLSEYAKDARIIHVEIDASEIDKNVNTDIAIHTDVKKALKCFSRNVQYRERKAWFSEINENKKKWEKLISPYIKKGVGPNDRLYMKTILSTLSKLTKGKDNIVADVGINQMISARYYNFQRNNSWFSSGGLGTMGAALPMGIGVKLARPDERVWVTAGDGGIQMNIQELGTLKEYGIDLKILVLNNEVLGMVRQWQSLFFEKRYVETIMSSNPDFITLAKAYDIPARRVSKRSEIEPAIRWAMKTKGPVLIEFLCEKDEMILPMVPAGATFKDMIVEEKE